ncbi:hypothetical protein JDV02_007107 [Purpureocillium takamizusanense]|uniref:Alpha/beta hydrolase fold-3 domain-containing protein n=1 Tax=Purpureocillium takamizusanense TaxID=2060973 RepID=A0A9Q8QJN4_9HYPO|nr:uncharacterized protein JDV02_007107 [Purpureocillium takamizusanense]UNI21088.1 hypothetical protein JDV02_007107 [Purpureocillium takamizusanense]
MILPPASFIDYLLAACLASALIVWQTGILTTVRVVFASAVDACRAVIILIKDRGGSGVSRDAATASSTQRSPRRRDTFSTFERLFLRLLRYGFTTLPLPVLRVAMSRPLGYALLRWRMARCGRWGFGDVSVEPQVLEQGETKTQGIWIRQDKEETRPDVIVYYLHGGCFAVGSCYFYLEFLLAMRHLLKEEAGFANPAVFALEYALAPERAFPAQLHEARLGYEHVLGVAEAAAGDGDDSRVCVMGDSAGGMLALSLLLQLAGEADDDGNDDDGESDDDGTGLRRRHAKDRCAASASSSAAVASGQEQAPALKKKKTRNHKKKEYNNKKPRAAVLLSPWVTLTSPTLHQTSDIDYLDRETLWRFGAAYAGSAAAAAGHVDATSVAATASPGLCTSQRLWTAAGPDAGYMVLYGEDETLAPDIAAFIEKQRGYGVPVEAACSPGGVHAWPVLSLLLSSTGERRLEGLRDIVSYIGKSLPVAAAKGR